MHQRADGAAMTKSTRRLAVRYGTALAIVGLALLVKLLLEYLIDVRTPFLLFYVAVMVSTLLGGLGPGLTAVAMSTVVTDFFFVAPNSLLIQSSEQNVNLVIFLLEGAAISILCVRLISARKRVESALEDARQSEGLRRSVIEQAIENIFLVDVETRRVLETNAALQHSLGYAPEDLKNMTLYDIVAHDKESVDRNIERVLENGRYVIGERSFRRKDGTLSEVEVSASAMSYGGRDVMCIVAHEVTDRKRAEEALREARVAERRRMARDLHDGAMQDLTYALAEAQIVQTLSQDPELNARIERKIEALRRVERELRSAVYNLRQEEARGVSLVRSVEALAELNHQMGPGRKIVIDVGEGFPDELPEAVSKELLRVVQEALTNARRHSGAQNVRVAVRTSEEEDKKLLAEVEDDGRGFDAGEEGLCAGAGGATGGAGIKGMGERARLLGGELKVESEPGQGTKVSLKMPLHKGTEGQPQEEEESEEEEQKVRILLVDDHTAIREALAGTLQTEASFEVVGQAGSLAEARRMLEEVEQVDVAIVDLGLPDGYGGDLIGELREANPQAQVLVLSASLDRAQIARSVERGAAGVLHKSAHLDEVVETVKRLRRGETLLPLEEVVELLRFAGIERRQEYEARQTIASLTPREREVLQALAEGLDSEAIAQKLYISVRTERNHMSSILAKLGVHSQLQALVFAVRHGLVEVR